MTPPADLPSAAARLADPGADADPARLKADAGALLVAALDVCARNGWDAAELAAAARRPRPSALAAVCALPRQRVAVCTGSFDPPTRFHRTLAERLRAGGFGEVVIRPDGPRTEHPEAEHAASIHRAVMTDLAFKGMSGVTVDLADLDRRAFTPHRVLERKYGQCGEVWHVVSDEFVTHGRIGDSVVQTRWKGGPRLWADGRFVVVHPAGAPPDPADLPPCSQLLPLDGNVATADLRMMIANGGPGAADDLVPPAVGEYIRRHGLFTADVPPREIRVTLDRPRLKIVTGPQPESAALADRYRHLESADPDLILVLGGDGTMLHAIRQHWRLRVPFLGLNAGHLGHLMNERLPADLSGAELVLYRMPLLRVDTVAEDGAKSRGLAFNDAWVERDSGQGAWLRVDVNGQERVSKVVADGLLVAMPSGSAAYARAMGATPVPLNSPVVTLAGSNVFSPRFWKAMALPDTTVIRMTSVGDPRKRPVRCYLDGLPLGRVRSMEARVSPVAAVEVAFTPEFDLSAKLIRSMFPPNDAA